MHPSATTRVSRFADLVSSTFRDKTCLRILDVGGLSINFKKTFLQYCPNIDYMTLNCKEGFGNRTTCDYLVEDAYDWKDVKNQDYDVVVSGSTLEHAEFPWLTVLEMRRVLKFGGWLCIVVPSHWPKHPGPLDAWRFYKDGVNALARFGGFKILYSGAEHPKGAPYSRMFGDAYVVAQKPVDAPCESDNLYIQARDACLRLFTVNSWLEITDKCQFSQSSHAWETERAIGSEYNVLCGDFTGEYAIHTSAETSPWIIVDMGHVRGNVVLKIFNRKNFEYRNKNLKIYSSANMRDWEVACESTGTFGGIYDGQPFDLRIPGGARYIRFELESVFPTYLHFDQIQIFELS